MQAARTPWEPARWPMSSASLRPTATTSRAARATASRLRACRPSARCSCPSRSPRTRHCRSTRSSQRLSVAGACVRSRSRARRREGRA
eukprot:6576235-Prymnesium_polylepis.1